MTAFLALGLSAAAPPADRPTVLVVVGAAGAAEYEPQFRAAADKWKAAAAKGGADFHAVGLDAEAPGGADRDRVRQFLAGQAAAAAEPLWVVLVGHGTFDGRDARFNARGPDFTAADLAGWLAAVRRPVAVVNGAAASGPFVPALSGPNRVVVTATRAGDEVNFARFGGFLADRVADPAADLDGDGAVSLLEAYLAAAATTAESYKAEGRLATEHPLLDDNGDKLGTPPDGFRGVRAVAEPPAGRPPEGLTAHQLSLAGGANGPVLSADARRRRGELEAALAALRQRKGELAEDAYFAEVDKLMVELARLYFPTGGGREPPVHPPSR